MTIDMDATTAADHRPEAGASAAQRRRRADALRHHRCGEGPPGSRAVPVPRRRHVDGRYPFSAHHDRLQRRRRRTTPTRRLHRRRRSSGRAVRRGSGADPGGSTLLHALSACLTAASPTLPRRVASISARWRATVIGDIDSARILRPERRGPQRLRGRHVRFQSRAMPRPEAEADRRPVRRRSAVYDIVTKRVPCRSRWPTGA